ncbi:P-loop containing nucleoside triphosphate hydrolase protein [Leptodontidium sp. 2 PMI_412]|nr:P-loop containing nucleoside triphosphate hydrolase protein [Leptodontidium sp. MPI-SDFR-AT-0119]KAH9218493.1 P-loop containing nucleoside triphosphate hydrolase protein [Leptodontidium sp. 2 PMI_412]
MSSNYDDFVHVSTGGHRSRDPAASSSHRGGGGSVSDEFFKNSSGKRIFSEAPIVAAIRAQHPKHHLTVSPVYTSDLLSFGASSDDVTYFIREADKALMERQFVPPARRYNDETGGAFADNISFAAYDYVYKGDAFLLYVVSGQTGPYGINSYNYILVDESESKVSAQKKTDDLLAAAAKWQMELHGEVLVFDQGYWSPNRELWENVQKSNWEDVILEKEKKDTIIEDVIGFFDAEDRYAEFGVPWKRGVIFYGPPGNGKTISTKALMHDISKRTKPNIESLYVKTFNSYAGPEYGIRQIFLMARRMAPCLLIFEDIDSLVSPMVRSYFLNEVDGLESNHGILMIGSTNHLERLDPGIAKRPSRFDRKYFFDVPSREERVQYADYWRNKLRDNKKIDFPKELSVRVADITADFSFAYMKEAFVAALLVIVARTEEKKAKFRHREDELSGNILWKELKKQIDSLRKEMDGEDDDDQAIGMSGMWPALNNILDERSERTNFGHPGMERPQFANVSVQSRQFPQPGRDRMARPMDINNAPPMPRYF